MDGHEEVMALGLDKLFNFCNELIAETEQHMKKLSTHTKEKEENTCKQMHIQIQKTSQKTEKEGKKNAQTDTGIER